MTTSPQPAMSPRRSSGRALRSRVAAVSVAVLALTACSTPDSGDDSPAVAAATGGGDTVIGVLCNAYYSLAAARIDADGGPLLSGTHSYLVEAQDALKSVDGDAEGDETEQYDTARKLIDAAVDTTPDMTIQEQLTTQEEFPPMADEGAVEGVEAFFTYAGNLEGKQRETFEAVPVCGAFEAAPEVDEDTVVTPYVEFMRLAQGDTTLDNEAFSRAIELLPLGNPPLPGSGLPDLTAEDYRAIAEAIGEIADGFDRWEIPEDATDGERRALGPLVWHRPRLADTYRAAADAAAEMAENPDEESFYALISAALESGTASARAVRMVPVPNDATLDELMGDQAQPEQETQR
ncbi:hypothetical protein [Corynebacterium pygosceleis]|uniref:Secreted protein n=1 Tax=Corynebacterium pygosceleis TaxID=2800406 RepID=A0ABT3WTB6_9CORY|nr:hypothetical protein [Corynebacterium pygosceleis]MCK7674186.1 hypothetical protein [Corynebacterium pygosceleis]MCL0120512.1 hypothetical protein [Corynebacterium pygosceleis]MCX7444063.1 hypothetical protein [Corynebacterium pygosceleis]